jgi:molybdopterin-guanine dinucleotide biosynthesis protein A
VARRAGLTGALLLGGASSRFGSPKALATYRGETLAARAWRTLAEVAGTCIAVGKAWDRLDLPFPVLDDGSDLRAPIVGVIAAVRETTNVCVILPVDCPLVTAGVLQDLADACDDTVDVAVPQTGPLPGAYRASALPLLEEAVGEGRLALRDVVARLRVRVVHCEPTLLANVNTPEELRQLG